MRLLGLDLGTRRIGVAVSDELGLLAHGLMVVTRNGGRRDLEAIARLVHEENIQGVVIGLPLNMDGSEGEAATRTRRFGAVLGEYLKLPVILWDERLTTWEAEGIIKEASVRKRKRKQLVDIVAATLILQSYLDAKQPVKDKEKLL
jgi:putative Holliday junction resolvase